MPEAIHRLFSGRAPAASLPQRPISRPARGTSLQLLCASPALHWSAAPLGDLPGRRPRASLASASLWSPVLCRCYASPRRAPPQKKKVRSLCGLYFQIKKILSDPYVVPILEAKHNTTTKPRKDLTKKNNGETWKDADPFFVTTQVKFRS